LETSEEVIAVGYPYPHRSEALTPGIVPKTNHHSGDSRFDAEYRIICRVGSIDILNPTTGGVELDLNTLKLEYSL